MANDNIDLVDLAHQLAEIASTTTDRDTGQLLTELVKWLLEQAGLPPDHDAGGGAPPSHWVSDPVDAAV